jgi:hypothetical protein
MSTFDFFIRSIKTNQTVILQYLTLSLALWHQIKLLHFNIWYFSWQHQIQSHCYISTVETFIGSIKTKQIVTFQYLTLPLALSKPYKLSHFNIWHFHWQYQNHTNCYISIFDTFTGTIKPIKLLHFTIWHLHWQYQNHTNCYISIFNTFTGSIKTIQIVIFQYLTLSLALSNQ